MFNNDPDTTYNEDADSDYSPLSFDNTVLEIDELDFESDELDDTYETAHRYDSYCEE